MVDIFAGYEDEAEKRLKSIRFDKLGMTILEWHMDSSQVVIQLFSLGTDITGNSEVLH